jgi:large subunit ribosomal protein L12
MELVYAGLLLHSAKKEITEENIEKIMNAVGIEVDKARIKALVNSLKEINIDEAIKESTAFVPAQAAPAEGEKPKEEKKEEKKEEEKAEEAVEGLSSLFG